MDKKFIASGVVASVLICATMISIGSAASITPGTSEDPVVSKSYVDKKFDELLQVLNTGVGTNSGNSSSNISQEDIVDSVLEQINKINNDTYNETFEKSQFEPVQLLKNQTITGDEGTEIILRSGSAIGFNMGVNGIINITYGTEIFNGDEINKNNLLIIPRDDGRGITATTDSWLMVKGGYEIK